MKYRLLKASLLSVTVVFSMLASAVEQSLDKVSVIVDQGVILESEISEQKDKLYRQTELCARKQSNV